MTAARRALAIGLPLAAPWLALWVTFGMDAVVAASAATLAAVLLGAALWPHPLAPARARDDGIDLIRAATWEAPDYVPAEWVKEAGR